MIKTKQKSGTVQLKSRSSDSPSFFFFPPVHQRGLFPSIISFITPLGILFLLSEGKRIKVFRIQMKIKISFKKTALCDGSGNRVLVLLFCHRHHFPTTAVIFTCPAAPQVSLNLKWNRQIKPGYKNSTLPNYSLDPSDLIGAIIQPEIISY